MHCLDGAPALYSWLRLKNDLSYTYFPYSCPEYYACRTEYEKLVIL